jgi:L-histidine N-alpha-methyltransferase
VRGLRRRYPRLHIEPRCADYTLPLSLGPAPDDTRRTACYFPGSTVGNFTRREAVAFLGRVAALVGPGGMLLIGADLVKDTAVLVPAYNDADGLTAEFNRNLLRRVNAELDADFTPGAFVHRAIWDGLEQRIEMQLISQRAQTVRLAGRELAFRSGEVLTTEYSHKYTVPGFAAMAAEAGFAVDRAWTDAQGWFSVQLLRAGG